ncbi:SET domain-containing protein [Abeliophyllum distichum]|uniref:SET domain-containing protein n=1 Tax=Abeliophyllum distichum TaxID=126358 RepID=A0ABD1VC32_9LAMI
MDIYKNMIEDTSEIDNDVQLVLELSKGVPFLSKKKKLLEDMGFDPEGSMSIRSSFTPGHLTSFLDMMLQRARIINLDEVELYFIEDAIDLGVFTNPRNELEALDSILKVIDKSLSSGKDTTANVLQNLRNVTVDRIHELGTRIGEETRILRVSNSDMENCLLEWGVNNGVKTKLDIAHVEGAGRGAIAREDLKVGDIALEIPLSVIISEDLLHESDMFPILEQIDGISSETMLLLWSMKEKHNQDSIYKLYFDTLPEEFNTGLSFGIDAVMELEGTLLLEEIVQAKEHLRIQYDELFPSLCDCHPDVFPRELYTWEQFLCACELWYSNSMKVMFSDGKLRTCLIPIAGFLNHSIFPHIMHYGRIDSTTNSLKFPLSRPCNAGEQCFLSYGNFSSPHLVTFYGFLPRGDNPYDVIPLDIDVPQDEDCEDGGAACEWNNHMVRGTWFSKNHVIFNYGLPRPLLNHLRRARSQMWQSNTLTRENLEIELEVLGDLCSTFEGMMEALGEARLDDRETTRWDVKLAVEFKVLQRRIISSILTSCYNGCKLLQIELHKNTVEHR